MKTPVAAIVILTSLFTLPAHAENRCGWIVNPTPANWWLNDADGEWIISTQGTEGAEGMDLMPDFTTGDWVVTNGSSYGYGCACMNVKTTTLNSEKRITRISSVRQLPMVKCEADRKLLAPDQ